MLQKPSAIVIGAGIGGLATAIRLAVQGFTVQVFEKNGYTGGKVAHFTRSGYKFDEGPSLFTQPQNIEALFTLAGEPIGEYLQYEALPVACRYFYENGKVINAYTNADAFAKELHRVTGEEPQAVTHYLEQAEKVYNNIGALFLNYSLHTPDILKAPLLRAVKTSRPELLFNTLHQLNAARFTQPETIQLFDRYATYNGSNPYKAPGMLSLIPHLEQNQGTYYPRGGMISIAKALHALAVKKGVTLHVDAPVTKIMVDKGQAKGVVVHGIAYSADIVVSNMDVYFTYNKLLDNAAKSRQILQQERSSSAIIFYWGISTSFAPLHLHNIFFSQDYKAEFDHLFTQKNFYHDPTVYINITSKMEADQAPAGCENWFVMVNAPANVGQNWQAFREQCRAAVLQKLSRMLHTDVESLIETETIMDPVIIEEKTASYMGSLYGTSSNSKLAAFLRHPNFTSAIKGLYFVGGSVHPGGGIPLCLHSARLVSDMISKQKSRYFAPDKML